MFLNLRHTAVVPNSLPHLALCTPWLVSTFPPRTAPSSVICCLRCNKRLGRVLQLSSGRYELRRNESGCSARSIAGRLRAGQLPVLRTRRRFSAEEARLTLSTRNSMPVMISMSVQPSVIRGSIPTIYLRHMGVSAAIKRDARRSRRSVEHVDVFTCHALTQAWYYDRPDRAAQALGLPATRRTLRLSRKVRVRYGSFDETCLEDACSGATPVAGQRDIRS